MGSDSDWEVMSEAKKALDNLGVAERGARLVGAPDADPDRPAGARGSRRGIEVVIAGAGAAAHLAGVCAAETELPVRCGWPARRSDRARRYRG